MTTTPAGCGADRAAHQVNGTARAVPDGYAVVCAHGEIDLATVSDLRQVLAEATAQPAPQVLVDLTAVTFMDSSGLHALISALRAAQSSGGDLKLVGAGSRVRKVIDLTGLDQLFPIHPTLTAAID